MNEDNPLLIPYIRFQYKDPSTDKLMNMITPQKYYNMALNDIYSSNRNWLTAQLSSKESNIIKELDKVHSLFKELHSDPEISYQFEDGIEMCKQSVENHHIHTNYIISQENEWYENEYDAVKSLLVDQKG